ncbi:hypothetical protein EJ02DRAFT_317397, partial [Clathrospora elynae]
DSQNQASHPQPYRQIAAAHIATLNEINNQLPKLLKYFGSAISQLTNNPISLDNPDSPHAPNSLAARKEAFRTFAIWCGMSVTVIREELTQQIIDLEKHKVIPRSAPKFTVAKRQGQKGDGGKEDGEGEVVDPEKNVKNAGYGEFDVGVLNARASSGQVGGEDVLDRIKAVLEELKRRS